MRGPGFVDVRNTATCKYCGNSQLAWVQSKAGKWFLADAFKDGDYGFVANKFQPHKCERRKS